jgi:glycosyltransferase involved in cell wall biosynthesis
MKVLWFTNTPSNAFNSINKKQLGGGWILSLENAFNHYSDHELGISFLSPIKMPPFINGKTNYFPIYNNTNGKFLRWYFRCRNRYFIDSDLQSMLNIIEIFKPDIIHIHGTEFHFGLIAEQTNIPIIISIQGILTVYLEKYFCGIPRSAFLKSLSIYDIYSCTNPVFQYRNIKKRAINEQYILKKAFYVAGRTSWDYDVTRVLASRSRYFVVNEILRPEFYNKKWSKKREDKLIITTTTSNSAYKGFEIILMTAKLLRSLNINFEWRVSGLSISMKNILSFEKEFSIKCHDVNVILIGLIEANDLCDNLLKSDIYIQVSHIENSPNSLCEAMLLGLPVIASAVGGTTSIVRDKYNGLLYQDGDFYSLCGKILQLRNENKKMTFLSDNAYIDAQKRHNPINVINELEYAYSYCIKQESHEGN